MWNEQVMIGKNKIRVSKEDAEDGYVSLLKAKLEEGNDR